jgi:hypothetical protein
VYKMDNGKKLGMFRPGLGGMGMMSNIQLLQDNNQHLMKPLIPREAFRFFPREEQWIKTKTEDIRIIFGGKIELSEEEKEKVARFREHVQGRGQQGTLDHPA